MKLNSKADQGKKCCWIGCPILLSDSSKILHKILISCTLFAILSSNYRIGFSKTGYHDDHHHCWIFALMDPLFLTRFEFLFFFSMTKIADKVRLLKAPWFKRIFHEEEFDRIKIWKKAFFTKYEVLFPFDYYYITQNDITVYSNPKNSCQTLTLQKEEAIKI